VLAQDVPREHVMMDGAKCGQYPAARQEVTSQDEQRPSARTRRAKHEKETYFRCTDKRRAKRRAQSCVQWSGLLLSWVYYG
jgi:hypothetical protein